ncbi:hypothetical protein Gotur_011485 [Gossypium turneri]
MTSINIMLELTHQPPSPTTSTTIGLLSIDSKKKKVDEEQKMVNFDSIEINPGDEVVLPKHCKGVRSLNDIGLRDATDLKECIFIQMPSASNTRVLETRTFNKSECRS